MNINIIRKQAVILSEIIENKTTMPLVREKTQEVLNSYLKTLNDYYKKELQKDKSKIDKT